MTRSKKNDDAVPKKKNEKSSKHEPPSTTSTKGLNRAARRKLLKETGVVVEHNASDVQYQQGEKIYACLHTNCTETFEIWQDARNHMNNCKAATDPHLLKPRIKDSRKKGNQLVEQGKVTKKIYAPMPTEAELVKKIRDFNSKRKKTGKGSLTDVRTIMRRVVKPEWGNSVNNFSSLGFGKWQDFLDTNDVGSVQESDADANSESDSDANTESDSDANTESDADANSESDE